MRVGRSTSGISDHIKLMIEPILKKGQGTDTDIEALSNKEKFLIISALKKKYSILSLLKHPVV
jgi:hypothetical protein